jgi:hypothetical protein
MKTLLKEKKDYQSGKKRKVYRSEGMKRKRTQKEEEGKKVVGKPLAPLPSPRDSEFSKQKAKYSSDVRAHRLQLGDIIGGKVSSRDVSVVVMDFPTPPATTAFVDVDNEVTFFK